MRAEGLAEIAHAVQAFECWLRCRFAGAVVLREGPLLALVEYGTVVSGIADLIVQTRDSVWIIVHKSDRIGHSRQAFRVYQPQLEAYAQALAGEGRPVQGIAIHWILRGEVVWQNYPAEPGRESFHAGPE